MEVLSDVLHDPWVNSVVLPCQATAKMRFMVVPRP